MSLDLGMFWYGYLEYFGNFKLPYLNGLITTPYLTVRLYAAGIHASLFSWLY